VQKLMQVPDLRHCVCSGRVRRWEAGPIKVQLKIAVVREGIDGGPMAHPMPPPPRKFPQMVPWFRVVSVLDGLSARLVTPGTYSATTECPPYLANWASTCLTGSFSLDFLDTLFTTDLVTVESVFNRKVTGEGHCLRRR